MGFDTAMPNPPLEMEDPKYIRFDTNVVMILKWEELVVSELYSIDLAQTISLFRFVTIQLQPELMRAAMKN